MNKTNV